MPHRGRPARGPRTFLRAKTPLCIPTPSTRGIQGFPKTTREAYEGSWLRARGQQEPEENLGNLGGPWERGGLWAGRTAYVRETRQAREPLNTLYLADQSWREERETSSSSPCQASNCPPRFQTSGGFSWHTGPPAPPHLGNASEKAPFLREPWTCPYRSRASRQGKKVTDSHTSFHTGFRLFLMTLVLFFTPARDTKRG